MASAVDVADIERELDDVAARSTRRRASSRKLNGRIQTQKLSPLTVDRRSTPVGQFPVTAIEDIRESTDSDFYDTDLDIDEDVQSLKGRGNCRCIPSFFVLKVREKVCRRVKQRIRRNNRRLSTIIFWFYSAFYSINTGRI